MSAIEAVTAAGDFLPADLGGSASTREVTDAVVNALEY
jgi:isocitrate/isopropylmalate dehydrogenase